MYLYGNLEANESAILEKWLDELLEEMDSQKDIVNDVIEQLSDWSDSCFSIKKRRRTAPAPSFPEGNR